MKQCYLCKNSIANKKNSHIIPHFLIQSMINVEGKKGRNRELSISIEKDTVSEYFGSAVSPEKIERYLGRPISDKEIENQKHHFSVDDIFCPECEIRLGIIEGYYSRSSKTEHNNIISNNINANLSFCFWASIVWRLSISEIFDFKLSAKHERKLGNLLNNCLATNIDKIKENVEIYSVEIQKYAYRLMCIDQNNDAEALCFILPKHKMPYSFVLNNYVLLFYASKNQVNQLKQCFFGFELEYEDAPINPHSNEKEQIKKLTDDFFYNSIKSLVEFKSSKFLNKLYKRIGLIHKFALMKEINPKKHIIILNRLVLEDPEILGDRYSDSRIAKIMYQVCSSD